MEKIIIVGAGFSGATIARLLAESGKEPRPKEIFFGCGSFGGDIVKKYFFLFF